MGKWSHSCNDRTDQSSLPVVVQRPMGPKGR